MDIELIGATVIIMRSLVAHKRGEEPRSRQATIARHWGTYAEGMDFYNEWKRLNPELVDMVSARFRCDELIF